MLLAVMAAASMWFYVNGILRAHQITDAQLRQIPRGNLSDLYPRWWGARELLLHHRNPYGRDVTLEIQEGYYGRRLDSSRPNDPKDQQGFAYPVYVVFLLAPLIGVPFPALLVAFYWFLALITAASVCTWLRVLMWRLPATEVAIGVLLALGSFAAIQGIKLQQLSLLVAGLLAGAAVCAAGGYFFVGGALLALATIKPQLTWALAAWMLLWALSDWRTRRRFIFGFAIVMALLLVAAEIILPGWLGMFVDAAGQYHRYTQNHSVLDELMPWASGGKILAFLAVLASAIPVWKLRRTPAGDPEFGRATALVLALTVLVVPMYAPYNQVLLVPAVLVLLHDRRALISSSHALRFGYLLGGVVLGWQWIASLSLTVGYMFSPAWALNRWTWPFFATFAVPVLVFAMILLDILSQGSTSHLSQARGAD